MQQTEFDLLRTLEKSPHASQRELARKLNVSLGAVNYCMQALVEKGWVKVGNFKASPNKWKYVYLLTPKGVKERAKLTRAFLARKLEEYERLEGEIELLRRELDEKA
jgi:EPS-associated MarR family transcriptional regulator